MVTGHTYISMVYQNRSEYYKYKNKYHRDTLDKQTNTLNLRLLISNKGHVDL